MKKEERASLVRVLVDLIKADSVIDEGEIDFYAKLKNSYSITREDEIAATSLTLADAVSSLSLSPHELRESLMSVFSDMTISDGFCAKQEAQLMIALIYCLSDDKCNMCSMYSIHEPDVQIEDNQVLYVETTTDTSINEDIVKNYRSIDKELRIAGFNFVYIPHIAHHFNSTAPELFAEITRFLAPNISDEDIPSLIEQLTQITTAEYCNEQLCNKLNLRRLRDVPPSLLIKISNTHVGENLYTNFLRITIDSEVLPLVQEITDSYIGMLSSDTRYISNNEDSHGQFLYHGFYKQLYDIYVIRKGIESKIVIDINRGKILLPGLGVDLTDMHRKEKALYLLLLLESPLGGLNMSMPKTAKQHASYTKRIKGLQNKYKILYSLFNGDKSSTPLLEDPEILRPMISNIRKIFKNLKDKLHNMEDYNVTKDCYGCYNTRVGLNMVYYIDRKESNDCQPIVNNVIYRGLYGKTS